MKAVFIWIAGIVAFLAVMFVMNVGGMYSKSFFGKWNEEIRYDIQKESQAHRDGLQRNLSQLMIQFNSADASGKVGIKMTTMHQYSQVDTTSYPAHL